VSRNAQIHLDTPSFAARICSNRKMAVLVKDKIATTVFRHDVVPFLNERIIRFEYTGGRLQTGSVGRYLKVRQLRSRADSALDCFAEVEQGFFFAKSCHNLCPPQKKRQ